VVVLAAVADRRQRFVLAILLIFKRPMHNKVES
jgi:hypothetical protein